MSVERGVRRLDLVRLRLPLAQPWITNAGTTVARDVLVVRVEVGGAVGWGECVAQGDPTYTSEYVEGVADVMRRYLIPCLVVSAVTSAAEVGPGLAAIKGHPMAKAAIEAAVLDAELRAAGVNLAEHLRGISAASGPRSGALTHAIGDQKGPPPPPESSAPSAAPSTARSAGSSAPGSDRVRSVATAPRTVRAGVAVGIAGSLPALLDEVGSRVDEGYRRVKLKVHPGWDIEVVRAVRKAWPDLALQVDANGAYAALGPSEALAALRPLDDQDLLLIEQPLGDDDLLGHRALSNALGTPICLDEAITSLAVAETALALGACKVVNIKAGRVGGYLEAVRIHDVCAARDVPVWCGGMLETGVGRAANLALATLDNFSLPGDLSASERFWADDIVSDPAVLRPDGTIAVPTGPGLGVEVKDLRPWTVETERLI